MGSLASIGTLAVSVAALLMRPDAAEALEFRLSVEGSAFVTFDGDCKLIDGRGSEHTALLTGMVPQAYAIQAEAVACAFRKNDVNGELTVNLLRDGALLAHASTRTSFGEVAVRSQGPWGAERATVTLVPIIPFHRFPPSQRSVLPPLGVPIVPPLRGQVVPPLR
jgi:hypothetical protein